MGNDYATMNSPPTTQHTNGSHRQVNSASDN